VKIQIPDLKQFDKKTLITAGALVFLFILAVFLFFQERRSERALASAKEGLSGFNALKNEYAALKADTGELERLVAMSPREGVMGSLENILAGMGLKGKIATLKAAGTRESEGLIQEEAELTMKKLTLNETINVLYKLENAPMMLAIQGVELKRSFTGNTIDLTLTAALTMKK
jgi:hypothetical protein